MRHRLALSGLFLVYVGVVALAASLPATAHAAEACFSVVGELDVVARSCAFTRMATVAPLAPWSFWSIFAGTTGALVLLRRAMLRMRWSGSLGR